MTDIQSVVMLIDGDVLCYRACEDRYTRRIANVDDFDAEEIAGYEKLTVYTGDVEFTDEENEDYLNRAFAVVEDMVRELCDLGFTTEFKMAVAGEGNYRKDIFPLYKANRHADPTKRNPFVPLLRKMAAEKGIATEAHGMEADDQIRIWAAECEAAGIPYIICSIDKDLKMIPGKHWLIHKREFFDSSEDFALRFFHEQLLMGDMTDNIQGVPGMGPIKAKAVLADCSTAAEYQEVVSQVYYSMVHQWKYALYLTGQLIYLKKHADDWFTLDGWDFSKLIDVDAKPKKKSKKKMEEWTIDSALAALDPRSITTRERWEAAVFFLIEQEGFDEHDAIEVLSNRDQVPKAEIDAYDKLKKAVKKLSVPAVPVFEALGLPPLPPFPEVVKMPFPDNLPITAKADTSYVPILPKLPEKITTVKPESAPLSILKGTSDGIHPHSDIPFLESVKTAEAPPKFTLPELPAFNPDWGRKK